MANEFAEAVYSNLTGWNHTDKTTTLENPFITLTYAQTLDGRVASLPDQPRLLISGDESMEMTYKLRSLHDGIMVTVSTLIADDPRLTVRGASKPASVSDEPQPIILDTKARTPLTCKLFLNAEAGTGRSPWIVCGKASAEENVVKGRINSLERHGATVLLVEEEANGHLPLRATFSMLASRGINRLLVESGLRLSEAMLESEPPLVDLLVVTTGHTLGGQTGRAPPPCGRPPKLEHLHTQIFGKDSVVACRISKRDS